MIAHVWCAFAVICSMGMPIAARAYYLSYAPDRDGWIRVKWMTALNLALGAASFYGLESFLAAGGNYYVSGLIVLTLSVIYGYIQAMILVPKPGPAAPHARNAARLALVLGILPMFTVYLSGSAVDAYAGQDVIASVAGADESVVRVKPRAIELALIGGRTHFQVWAAETSLKPGVPENGIVFQVPATKEMMELLGSQRGKSGKSTSPILEFDRVSPVEEGSFHVYHVPSARLVPLH